MILFSAGDLQLVAPTLVVAFFAMLVLIHDGLVRQANPAMSVAVSALGVVLAGVLNVRIGSYLAVPMKAFGGLIAVDAYATAIHGVVLLSGLGTMMLAYTAQQRQERTSPEVYPFILLSLCGMLILVSANDLLVMVLGLELMGLGLLVPQLLFGGVGSQSEEAWRTAKRDGLSLAVLLYGVAFVYGAVGATRLDQLRAWLETGHTLGEAPLLVAGFSLLLIGFAFKVAAVPFHLGRLDLLRWAPVPVVALMATGGMVASMGGLGRLLLVGFLPVKVEWVAALWGLSVATILVGNLGAWAQNELKSLLVYGSIGQIGTLLMAVVVAAPSVSLDNPHGAAFIYLLLAYTLMNLGAFSAVVLLGRDGREAVPMERLAGLATRHPVVAVGLGVSLLALAGIPPTMGFVGRFYWLAAAVESGLVWLTVLGGAGVAIGLVVFLRPVLSMVFADANSPAVEAHPAGPALGVLCLVSLALIGWGLLPHPTVDWAQEALLSLTGWNQSGR